MARPAPFDTRLTIEQYYQLTERGLLGPDDRVELLEGVVVGMSPQSPPHAAATQEAARLLQKAVGDTAIVRVQLPLQLGASVPEPDVAVVPSQPDRYRTAHPTTALLVVEVADSTVAQDRISKARIYAAAGVPDYWIVNLRDGVVEVFSSPDPARRSFAAHQRAHRGERLAPGALPGVSIAVLDLLGPESA